MTLVQQPLLTKYCGNLASQATEQVRESQVRQHFDLIQSLTDVDCADDFVTKLLALDLDDSWVVKAQKAVAHGSPMSIAMIYRQLQTTKHLSLKEGVC